VFDKTPSEAERGAWRAFKAVTTSSLTNSNAQNYESTNTMSGKFH
jgi:hypothetical protein